MTARFHSGADRVARVQLQSVWAHLALLAASGVLLALAFPRPGWGILAHVGLAPMTLLAAWAFHFKRLLWTGFLVSFGWWLLRISWLTGVTGGGYAGLAALMAAYWAAYLLCFRAIHRRFHLPAVVTVPLVWVAFEWARGTFLSGGFPWLALAHTQAPALPGDSPSRLIQTADLFGEWTVSFIVAMSSGVLVDVALFIANAGTPSARSVLRGCAVPISVWLITLIAAHAYGGWRIGQFDDATTPGPVVAVVQTNVPQSNKNTQPAWERQDDWRQQMQLLERLGAVEQEIDIIALPETTTVWPINDRMIELGWGEPKSPDFNSVTVHRDLAGVAAAQDRFVIAGSTSLELDFTEAGEPIWDSLRRYNSAFIYTPDGSRLDRRYDKVHRVPFGEYIPWIESWPWLKEVFLKYLSPYEEDYTLVPGDGFHVYELAYENEAGESRTVRVATPICFEDAFARTSRSITYKDGEKRVDLLINLTNDGWYPGTDQGPQHFQMATLRCVEARVPMARAVNTGVSGFIDSVGRVGPFVEVNGRVQEVSGARFAPVRLDERSTLFGRVGQWPMILLFAATMLLTAIAWAQQKKATV